MAPEFADSEFFEIPDDPSLQDFPPEAEATPGPSLPIILFSAACGIGVGIIALYVTYRLLLLALPVSAGIATLMVLGTLSVVGGALSALSHANPLANIFFSCGLILLTIFFFAFCSLIGALAATLVLSFSY